MKVVSLIYHDVVENSDFDSSGIPGNGAARYKLNIDEFRQHLEAINEHLESKPRTSSVIQERRNGQVPFLLTFDDGGSSAYNYIADLLESLGWYGHFLITTNFIGNPTFLNQEQIRGLRKRGHILGSHSCSHPMRMSTCSWEQLVEEWGRSVDILSDILGEQINIASVPGGYYSRRVAKAAASAGINILFTSEPTSRCHDINGCKVIGRYMVLRGMSPKLIAKIATGKLLPRIQQSLLWNLKKIPKNLGGEYYLKARRFILDQSYGIK